MLLDTFTITHIIHLFVVLYLLYVVMYSHVYARSFAFIVVIP